MFRPPVRSPLAIGWIALAPQDAPSRLPSVDALIIVALGLSVFALAQAGSAFKQLRKLQRQVDALGKRVAGSPAAKDPPGAPSAEPTMSPLSRPPSEWEAADSSEGCKSEHSTCRHREAVPADCRPRPRGRGDHLG